jgi:uncharacterized membrane protein
MSPRKKKTTRKKGEPLIEYASHKATRWIGSPASLILHTLCFVVSFLLYFLGIELNTILLVLTTLVSLEAIYLSIFIQMSVNRQDRQLQEVSADVEEIHDNVEEMQEDVEEIQADIDEIQEDVDEIQEDVEDIQEDETDDAHEPHVHADKETLSRIEVALRELGKEIAEMKRQNQKK